VKLLLLALPLVALSGCMTPGGVAKAIEAIAPPKEPGVVTFEFTGWNTHFIYRRDTTGAVAATNGAVSIIPTTTFKLK